VRPDWDLGPATGLVLLGGALGLAVVALGAFLAGHPRRGRRASDEVAEALARRTRLARFLRRRLDPAEATGLALTVALALVFLAALGFGLVADMVTSRTGLYRLDAAAADWGARHATAASTRVLLACTQLGATVTVVALAAAAGLLEWARRRRLAVLGFMLTVVYGQNLIANGVKLLVDRARPPVPHLAAASGFSFPSGHTAAAAAAYPALVLVLGRGRRWPVKAWLGAGTVAVVLAVAASRVLLGVHWLTDVVGGAALGFAWFAVSSVAFGGALLRFGAPVERAEAAAARPAGAGQRDPERGC
jgi:membrane-associated phospholipid phosphatase